MDGIISYWPNSHLLMWLLVVFLLDFASGVIKATLNGTRRTFTKFMQYGGSIIIGMVLLNIVYDSHEAFGKQFTWLFGDMMLYIMIYIEVVSIFENLEKMSPQNDFVKYLRACLNFNGKFC